MSTDSPINILPSFLWKLLERTGSQIIQLIIQLLLARLLGPDTFGIIAILLIFINISQVFIDSGFSMALIQKRDISSKDYSTVFLFSLFISLILFFIIYNCAPLISKFYNEHKLIFPLRMIAITLFPMALSTVQNAYVSRNMLFNKLFIANISATLVSGVVAVYMAYHSFGIWALVVQQIIFRFLGPLILYFLLDLKFKLFFSLKIIKDLFSFGGGILVGSLIYSIYMELRTLLIGKFYSASDLAYYQRGDQIPKLVITNVNNSIESVLFPTLSSLQNDINKMLVVFKNSIKFSSFFITPLCFGIAGVSHTLIQLLLGDAWLPTIPYLRVFALTYSLWPILSNNLQMIRAKGRSDLIVKYEFIKRIIGFGLIFITASISPMAMACSFLLESIIECIINSIPSKFYFNYGIIHQVRDIIPSLINSLIMLLFILMIDRIISGYIILKLFIQVVVGVSVYFLCSFVNNRLLIIKLANLMKRTFDAKNK
ncbi:lipopolysaccharide biosynthesis protein [Aerococcus tenax]|uniref:lipopolysaccharide biosynthesis protein n=2 Tax=Aerococcus tenax TaxID=3078812 RepID=UPI0018A7825F|nr:lipopolysaccharide biosynthesis protein [Aerococcus tenax]